MHKTNYSNKIRILLLASVCLLINTSLYAQSLKDTLNKTLEVDMIDTLESITITGVDKNIIQDYLNVTKSLKHYNFNKFQADYSIVYKRNNSEPVSLFGNTLFVSTPRRPTDYYYPIVDGVDSVATHLSAWNIHIGGRAIYYVEMPSKLFQSAQKNRVLLLHVYNDNNFTLFTITDRRKIDDKTTIVYDNAQKKITQIIHTMHNTSFLDISFDSVETSINLSIKGKQIIPTDIKTILKTADQSIEIFNYNLSYSYLTPKEYKHLVKIGVYKE